MDTAKIYLVFDVQKLMTFFGKTTDYLKIPTYI